MILKNIHHKFLFAATVILLSGCSASENITTDKNLPNFYKINSNLYRGGQLNEAGVKTLREKYGIKTVILFRSKGENADRERKWVESQGLKFLNLPLHNWFAPKHDQVNAALKEIIDAENQPVFIHCNRGSDRTGTMIAVYRMTQEGWTAKEAKEEAEKFGIGWWQIWMREYITDYHEEFVAEK
ncbi:MAG: tyrosine-protein phosphatase [Pyrinomonadaceae bacterium]